MLTWVKSKKEDMVTFGLVVGMIVFIVVVAAYCC